MEYLRLQVKTVFAPLEMVVAPSKNSHCKTATATLKPDPGAYDAKSALYRLVSKHIIMHDQQVVFRLRPWSSSSHVCWK